MKHTNSLKIMAAAVAICCLAALSHGDPATFVLFGGEDRGECLKRTPLSKEAFRLLDPLSTDEIAYAEKVCTEEGLVYAHATPETLKEGAAFSWRGGRFFCLFAENPVSGFEKQALLSGRLSEEDKAKFLKIVKQAVEIKGALWIYSADAALDLKEKLSTPLAILEIVSTSAAEGRVELAASEAEAGYSFVIYVAAGRLNFGNASNVSDKMAAIRFFTDFLTDNPEKDFICLGSAEEGVAYFRERLAVCDDAEALKALDERMRKASAARLASVAAPKRDFVLAVAPLSADRFIKPEVIKQFGPFDWTSNPEKATHPCEKTELADRASFREMNPDGMPLIGYAGRMSSFPWTTDGKEYGLREGVWYLLRNDKMFARFVWRPQSRRELPSLSYEAALFLYPANPNLTHMWSPYAILEKPLAVLTIENDPATPAPFFCAFTPESHLNFGLCERPKSKKEAARFFFEFLCEQPQREVYCLGSDRFTDNVGIRSRFERATFELKETNKEISPEQVLEKLKPEMDKAKAESKAMAEKYDMVLWPDEARASTATRSVINGGEL